MRAWRGLLSGFFFAGFAAGSLLLGSLVLPALVACPARSRGRLFRRAVRAGFRAFVACARLTGMFRVEASPEDRARIAATRGAVVAMNHVSLIDVVILLSLLPDATGVAKVAAARNAFYARIVRSAFLPNDDPERVLSAACAALASGTNVVVFPEGTRTPPDVPARTLRRGAARIALAAGVPVDCWFVRVDPPVLAKGQPWWDVGARTISFSLEFRGAVDARAFGGECCGARARAAAMTEEIGERIFGAARSPRGSGGEGPRGK